MVMPLEDELKGNNDAHTMNRVTSLYQTRYTNLEAGGKKGATCILSVLKKVNVQKWMDEVPVSLPMPYDAGVLHIRMLDSLQTHKTCPKFDLSSYNRIFDSL